MAKVEIEYEWHWRNSMKPARFFSLDARAGSTLILVLLHLRLWTLGLMVVVMAVFWVLERKGLGWFAAWRAARLWLIGPDRPAYAFYRRRKLTDYE